MYIKPQGPKGYPLIGSISKLASPNRLEWLQSITNTYGDVVAFNLLKKDFYLINHPDLVKDLLTRNSDNYTKKTVGFKIIKVVLGESTFTSMGDEWRRKRLAVQPSFHKSKIVNLATIMTDCIEEMLTEWETLCDDGQTLQLTDAMMHVTLKVVVKALFSSALSDADIHAIATAFTPLLEATNRRVLLPIQFLHKLPLSNNKKYQGYIKTLDDIIYRIIKERKATDDKPLDLLQMLIDATDEATGLPLTDQELRNEAMTMFIAGHETTANAMCWLWTILSTQSEIRTKIEHEVDEVLGGRTPVAADFPNLPYCLKAFKETMRLYPPVPILPRHVEKDATLGQYHLKGGSDVLFSPYLLHRHPDFWDQPEVFDPHRFDEAAQRQRHTYAYIPFGGGPRICLGNNFALMEAVFIIAMTTQRFQLNLHANAKIDALIGLTTRPKYGVPVVLKRRQAAEKTY
jgi:cytochrome P450